MTAPAEIQIRDRIELRVPAGESIAVFAVRVQDFASDGIIIDRPIIEQRLMPVVPGREIEIIFQRQDATYRFQTRIVREDHLEKLPVLVIEPPKQVDRIQRREYFRLDIDLPVRYRKLAAPGGEALCEYMRGMILDLSAGGVKFWADIPSELLLDIGDVLMFGFNLSSTLSVAGLEGRILKKIDDLRLGDRFTFACRFLNIPSYIQEAIVVHNIRYQQRYRVENRGR